MSALRAEYKFHPISGWISRHKELQRGVSCMDIDLFYENHIRGFCLHLWSSSIAVSQFSEAQRSNIANDCGCVVSKASSRAPGQPVTTTSACHNTSATFVVMIAGRRG